MRVPAANALTATPCMRCAPLLARAGSDGLWDNAYSSELLELVPASPEGVDDAADAIARLARRHAADPDWASPYTAEAKAQG